MIVVTAALFFAFALLLWAFAVFVWDLLEGRGPGWLRVALVVLLAPSCALGAAVISAVAGLALAMVLAPDEAPVGPSEPPANSEPADREPTSDERGPETTSEETASPPATPSPSPSPAATPSPSPSP
jgi:hypothetical protein